MSNKFSGELEMHGDKIQVRAWRKDATGKRIGADLYDGDTAIVFISGEHISGVLRFIEFQGVKQWMLETMIQLHQTQSITAEIEPRKLFDTPVKVKADTGERKLY